ncbi:MAG: hypothetical protein KKH08_04710 [Candidatus Omnitrophica bacterium]|nr:hypothetical protein [Candidatus Omnitrophota bacterium]
MKRFGKALKLIKIALIPTSALFLCSAASYPSASAHLRETSVNTLRLPIGDLKRADSVISKTRKNPEAPAAENSLSLAYKLGAFKKVKRDYEGPLIIKGEKFTLSIRIVQYAKELIFYFYTLDHNGDNVVNCHWKYDAGLRDAPILYSSMIKEGYRKDEIGKIKKSLEGVSLAGIMTGIVYKDMTESGVKIANVIHDNIMRFLPPNPKVAETLKRLGMVPLNTEDIIKKINSQDGYIRLVKYPEYPFFRIGQDHVEYVVLLGNRDNNTPLDLDNYNEIVKDPDYRSTLVKAIKNEHKDYMAYIGGDWGFDPKTKNEHAKKLTTYLTHLPSWKDRVIKTETSAEKLNTASNPQARKSL